MLSKAAQITLQYQEILNELTVYRKELYDCAEIPHMFDYLLEANLLQTHIIDEQQINNSLLYMKETGQDVVLAGTIKSVQGVWQKIEGLWKKLSTVNSSYLKIQKELVQSPQRIAVNFLDQLQSLCHIINRYFQEE